MEYIRQVNFNKKNIHTYSNIYITLMLSYTFFFSSLTLDDNFNTQLPTKCYMDRHGLSSIVLPTTY